MKKLAIILALSISPSLSLAASEDGKAETAAPAPKKYMDEEDQRLQEEYEKLKHDYYSNLPEIKAKEAADKAEHLKAEFERRFTSTFTRACLPYGSKVSFVFISHPRTGEAGVVLQLPKGNLEFILKNFPADPPIIRSINLDSSSAAVPLRSLVPFSVFEKIQNWPTCATFEDLSGILDTILSADLWSGSLSDYKPVLLPPEGVRDGLVYFGIGCGGTVVKQKYHPSVQQALRDGKYVHLILIDPFLANPLDSGIITTEADNWSIVYLNYSLTGKEDVLKEVAAELKGRGFQLCHGDYAIFIDSCFIDRSFLEDSVLIGSYSDSSLLEDNLEVDDIVRDILEKTTQSGERGVHYINESRGCLSNTDFVVKQSSNNRCWLVYADIVSYGFRQFVYRFEIKRQRDSLFPDTYRR